MSPYTKRRGPTPHLAKADGRRQAVSLDKTAEGGAKYKLQIKHILFSSDEINGHCSLWLLLEDANINPVALVQLDIEHESVADSTGTGAGKGKLRVEAVEARELNHNQKKSKAEWPGFFLHEIAVVKNCTVRMVADAIVEANLENYAFTGFDYKYGSCDVWCIKVLDHDFHQESRNKHEFQHIMILSTPVEWVLGGLYVPKKVTEVTDAHKNLKIAKLVLASDLSGHCYIVAIFKKSPESDRVRICFELKDGHRAPGGTAAILQEKVWSFEEFFVQEKLRETKRRGPRTELELVILDKKDAELTYEKLHDIIQSLEHGLTCRSWCSTLIKSLQKDSYIEEGKYLQANSWLDTALRRGSWT